MLKAGAAYVPLDRNYPGERIAFMLSDCEAPILIADKLWASQHQLPASVQKVISPELDGETRAGQSKDVSTPTDASGVAYILYTSGSTGRPKGVLVPHRGVVRLVRHTNYLEFTQDQLFLQLAP